MSHTIKMEVSKTVEVAGQAKRESIGFLELYAPTLEELGFEYKPASTDETTGELVYEDKVAAFLYNAVLAATKANARNKLDPKAPTLALRPGATLPANLEELVTPTVSNKGQALAERRALIESFKEWAHSLAKPDALKAALVMLFDKPDNLALQDADKRAKIKPYFEEFGNSVAERLTDWQANYISGVLDQCDAAELEW